MKRVSDVEYVALWYGTFGVIRVSGNARFGMKVKAFDLMYRRERKRETDDR